MKKILLLISIIFILALGCEDNSAAVTNISGNVITQPETNYSNSTSEVIENTSKDTTEVETKTDIETEIEVVTEPIIDPWTLDYDMVRVSIPYDIPEYTPILEPYDLNMDTIFNKDQYYNFSDNQIKMIEENGFVVLKPKIGSYLKMHHTYERAEYDDLPIFITSDVVLNMYHIFYSESMKYLELSSYSKDLIQLTESLLDKSLLAYEMAEDKTKEDLKYVAAYFAVGAKLLGVERALPEDIDNLVESELTKIYNAKGFEASEIFNLKLDYSQYTVRGHYTSCDELSEYFRSMMWFGQSGFQLTEMKDGKLIFNHDNISRSLMATTLLLGDDATNFKRYIAIYDMTNLYSGYSDDLNIFDFVELIKTVYGSNPKLTIFNETSYYQLLEQGIIEMRSPEINAKVSHLAVGKQFRLMGQRYTLDADIMQNLMAPLKRPVPTAFDVLSAFGHEKAEEILYKYYETNQRWEQYDDSLLAMKEKVNQLTESQWQSNLYHGWLWGIDAAATSFEETDNMPLFMQNEAWSHKSISAALGSFAELKHDNILYSKQAMAEMGGEMFEPVDYHYVEPNVELYSRLLWLIEYTQANLEMKSSASDSSIGILDEMKEMLELLLTCSIKELEGELLTAEEMDKLGGIGGLIDYINYRYLGLQNELIHDFTDEDTSALIADVATIGVNYLEEAIGIPMEIYVLCEVNGERILTRGSVYSYYEFVSDKRYTDEEWLTNIGVEKEVTEYLEVHRYTEEKIDILKMMPWMTSYISPEPNNVESIPTEVYWDNSDD